MSDTSARIKKLTPEQKALLFQRLQQARSVQEEHILPYPRKGNVLPLSSAQQRLWLHGQLEPTGYLYTVPLTLRLKGPLQVGVLEASLQEIIRRHETLRTTFEIREGELCQVIGQTPAFSLKLIELPLSPLEEGEKQLLTMLCAEARQPFDLVRGPLLRATLFRLESQEHVLLLALHHIVCDGWSRSVLFQELTVLYEAFLHNKLSPLPELSIQYADFAQWEREEEQIRARAAHLAYWRDQLADASRQIELPSDAPRPPMQTFFGSRHLIHIPVPEVVQIKQICQQESCTLFMFLLASFQILLYRYSGQEDMVIGVPIANRTHAEIEQLIGFFVNTLVLRTNLSDKPTFRQLLQRVREVTLAAFVHQDLPFEQLVEALQTRRDLSMPPLFQAAFVLQNAPMVRVNLPSIAIEPIDLDLGVTPYDLTLALIETEQELQGYFEYNSTLFTAATIARLATHWQVLMTSILTNPDQPVAYLDMLTPTERQQLLVDWQAPPVDYPRMRIHQVFEQQVQRTPEALAVVFRTERLTYRELNLQANQLAHYLCRLGVGPDTLVGLCIERSTKMLVGMLGILKAGGAYVPLDPAYPQKRLEFMLNDADIHIVLTQERLRERLPVDQVVLLDTEWPIIAREDSINNPQSEGDPTNLAYVIHTSGSTGNPKGVLIEHESVVSFCSTLAQLLQLRSDDHVIQFATINFDAAVHEIYATLFIGATLYICPPENLLPVEPILQFLRRYEISVALLPPSVLTQLPAEDLPHLRLVFSAGEACTEEIVRRWAPVAQLYNLYGPAETTAGVTYATHLQVGQKPPLGHALPNRRLYVLDAHQQLVPPGIPGELCIGGTGLARGYLRQPMLTAEKFIPDPFSQEPGARLYRSGDLVRQLPDGTFDFLGRLDHQIKLRGYRIELGEIETTLLAHDFVRECVVSLHPSPAGDQQLVAYLTLNEGEDFSVGTLRAFLRERLPEYMIPVLFIPLTVFPLTLNGKIDREALPDPATVRQPEHEAYVAPQSAREREIAAVWQEVLGLTQVGLHDNFFDLGGHSLRMARLQHLLQVRIQQDIALLDLFKYPTVSSFARSLGQKDTDTLQAAQLEQLQAGQKRKKLRLARNQTSSRQHQF